MPITNDEKNPCRDCNIFKKFGCNTSISCYNCRVKEKYFESIGVAGLPAENIRVEKDKKIKDKKPVTKVCYKKDCIHKGKPQPLENSFYKNKTTEDGYQTECKDCRKIMMKEAYKKKKLKKTKCLIDVDKLKSRNIYLQELFKSDLDLLEKLNECAYTNFRTPSNQLLAIVSKYFEYDRGDRWLQQMVNGQKKK